MTSHGREAELNRGKAAPSVAEGRSALEQVLDMGGQYQVAGQGALDQGIQRGSVETPKLILGGHQASH